MLNLTITESNEEVSTSAGSNPHHRSEYKSGYFVSNLRLSEVHFQLNEAGKKQRKHCRPFINKRRKSYKPISAQSESGLPYTSAGKSRQTMDAKRCIEHFVKERTGKSHSNHYQNSKRTPTFAKYAIHFVGSKRRRLPPNARANVFCSQQNQDFRE